MSAPVGPRMQAAGLQCLELQIAAASPDPQTRAFPLRRFPTKLGRRNFGGAGTPVSRVAGFVEVRQREDERWNASIESCKLALLPEYDRS